MNRDIIDSIIENKDSIKRHKFRDCLREALEYCNTEEFKKTGKLPKELDKQFNKKWDEATDELMENLK